MHTRTQAPGEGAAPLLPSMGRWQDLPGPRWSAGEAPAPGVQLLLLGRQGPPVPRQAGCGRDPSQRGMGWAPAQPAHDSTQPKPEVATRSRKIQRGRFPLHAVGLDPERPAGAPSPVSPDRQYSGLCPGGGWGQLVGRPGQQLRETCDEGQGSCCPAALNSRRQRLGETQAHHRPSPRPAAMHPVPPPTHLRPAAAPYTFRTRGFSSAVSSRGKS